MDLHKCQVAFFCHLNIFPFLGYDISNADGYDKMMSDFESIIGLKYLKALHINDSKGKQATYIIEFL